MKCVTADWVLVLIGAIQILNFSTVETGRRQGALGRPTERGLLNGWQTQSVARVPPAHWPWPLGRLPTSPFRATSSSLKACAYTWLVFCNFLIQSASSFSRRATCVWIWTLFSFSSLMRRIRSNRCCWRFRAYSWALSSFYSSFWPRIMCFMVWALSSSESFCI